MHVVATIADGIVLLSYSLYVCTVLIVTCGIRMDYELAIASYK